MQFEVKATPASGQIGRWAVTIFPATGSLSPREAYYPIDDWTADHEGNFTAATPDLPAGDYYLQGDVVTGETKLTVALTPAPTLTPPVTAPWPLVVTRTQRTHVVGVRYFTV
jgi:hypothetical protein